MKAFFVLLFMFCVVNTQKTLTMTPSASTISNENKNRTNLAKIQKAIKQNNANWLASETSVSKFFFEEQTLFLGINPESIGSDIHQKVDIPISQNLPAHFSWRDNNGDWLTPAKNQLVQQCGSCWAFAAVGLVESWWKITNQEPDSMIDLSEQFLISCSPAGNCSGGWPSHALAWISQHGIPSEECMPYMASDTVDCESCCENWGKDAVKIPGWAWVTTDWDDIETIKNAVYRQPIISYMDVYGDFVYYSGGLYEHVTGDFIAGHVVVIYGWDDEEQSWLCKNSTGRDWGEDGDFRIKWGNCNVGKETLMIWDVMTGEYPFAVYPQKLSVELAKGATLDTSVTITNQNSSQLEFTTFNFENEPTFHSSAYNSYDGVSIWCGDEKLKGYGNWWIKYLDTPVLDLSATSSPEFSCMMKWSTDGDPIRQYDGRDGGNLMISVDGGKNFDLLLPDTPFYNCDSMLSHWMYGIPYGTGSWSGMTNWQHVRADLSEYKSDEVIIRFTFLTTDGNCTINNSAWKGLFIDSLSVKDNNTKIYENQGENIDDMRRSGIGGTACSWIEISEHSGLVAADDSIQLNFNINATTLDTGKYNGSIVLSTNNKYYEYYEIPVKLHIIQPTSISSQTENIPQTFALFQNYPNPFNPVTTINFALPHSGFVKLRIYNVLGEEVATLVSERLTAGSYKYNWDASGLASGVYLYNLQAGRYVEYKKMMLLR